MSAGWCVKCNFSTMILLLAPELHQAGQGPRGCHASNMIVKRLQLTHAARSPRHSFQA
jgi:hypothetical protein